MKILEAREKDIPALIELNSEVQGLHINWYPEKYKKINKNEIIEWFSELLKGKDVKILIAFTDSKAVGYAISKIIKTEENVFKYSSRFIEIDQIAVTEEYKNKSIGKRLVEEIKSYAKNLGISIISLFVLDKNSNAIKTYTNMGFEPEGIKMTLKLKS